MVHTGNLRGTIRRHSAPPTLMEIEVPWRSGEGSLQGVMPTEGEVDELEGATLRTEPCKWSTITALAFSHSIGALSPQSSATKDTYPCKPSYGGNRRKTKASAAP